MPRRHTTCKSHSRAGGRVNPIWVSMCLPRYGVLVNVSPYLIDPAAFLGIDAIVVSWSLHFAIHRKYPGRFSFKATSLFFIKHHVDCHETKVAPCGHGYHNPANRQHAHRQAQPNTAKPGDRSNRLRQVGVLQCWRKRQRQDSVAND